MPHDTPFPGRYRPLALALLLGLAACTASPPVATPARTHAPAPTSADPPGSDPRQPEIATDQRLGSGRQPAAERRFRNQAVAAAHPLAAEAGLRMLRDGGSAVDAAVAVQAMLGLVEPQSSGIGGGGFLLVHDPRDPHAPPVAWDGRETAPAAADARQFLGPEGEPIGFDQAVASGRAVGTPGVLAMLEAAHREHGRLPWARLFEPAIRQARAGFPVGARLAAQIAGDARLRADAGARALFFHPDGRPLQAGEPLHNPDYAAVLEAVARDGAQALHQGRIGRAIVAAVQQPADRAGRLEAADLLGYRPVRREALCLDWRRWRLCGMPPPSSGMLTIGQILGLLEQVRPPSPADLEDGLPGVESLHAYGEAARLAFADRDRYIADPAFARAPGGDWTTLWRPDYLRQRARLIGPRSMGRALPGQPAPAPLALADDRSPEVPATSHLSVVDRHGMAVAMTTTIEAQFGSRRLVNSGQGLAGGFLLNNELTDFSFVPEVDGRPVANRIEPGKRPRSSMAPTLVYERRPDGRRGPLVASLGSPGGAVIIHYVARTLLGQLAWGLSPQQAIELPHAGSLNGPTLLERGQWPRATVQALRERGHEVREVDLPSGLHSLTRHHDGGWIGGADARREGVVVGD
ncbi:gamma-glutamyltransferase 1 [Sphaerotilus hippei]|uniref:Gamma-glutamyltransferase 1 n=1 Tax=Sphaerotilus hippei TaxID=744406 RepID=A0A318H125_9BURK|nr:gamma-glutamyltransferase family protein [Sphaerotilus hippei]PXW95025.1 gamma-glutamyltransferase 1 [Sphaerotilus hippei]